MATRLRRTESRAASRSAVAFFDEALALTDTRRGEDVGGDVVAVFLGRAGRLVGEPDRGEGDVGGVELAAQSLEDGAIRLEAALGDCRAQSGERAFESPFLQVGECRNLGGVDALAGEPRDVL